MKIRSGFVSNSSSSSFYLARTEKPISFEDISKYYEINTELPEEERVWLSICIWTSLREVEKYENYKKSEGEEDYRYNDSSKLEDYLSENNIRWMEGNKDYFKIPEGHWDKVRKLKDNPYGVISFSIDSVEGLELPISQSDDIRLPFDFTYDIRYHANEVFMNNEKGLSIGE